MSFSTSIVAQNVSDAFFFLPELASMATFLESYKPVCSECQEVFEGYDEYSSHMEECSKHANRSSVKFQTHLLADNIVTGVSKIGQMAGAPKRDTKCSMCKDDLEYEDLLKWHTKNGCKYYTEQFEQFKKNTSPLFKNLIDSHKRLSSLLQYQPLTSDAQKSLFKQQHKKFKAQISELMDDCFISWLQRKARDPKVWFLRYRFTCDVREDGEDYSDLESLSSKHTLKF